MRYLVTSALPYANGRLHVGHVAGAYLPADIYVRYLKMKTEDVIYICGTDEHGTPISISADKENTTPASIVQRYHKSIKAAFDKIGIEFDNFSGTAREGHYRISQEFFTNLYDKGHIVPKDTTQLYCEHDQRFLPDRYVEGICPRCKQEGARGDQCDACGATYDATTLIEPKCKICGTTPVIRSTRHWFLKLDDFTGKLTEWISSKTYWKENVRNFMLNLLEQGLVERSITRDLSWGVPVPLPEAEGKVLYVWFDAPIGYISSTIEWAEKIGQPDRWKDYWLDPNTQMIHFIGKDNIVFHSIIWPAMLMGQDKKYCLPHDIPANEFLNLEGQKVSTSKDWAVWVDEFAETFPAEYLRYYLAVNAPETKDMDFSFRDFQARINNELNNVLGNLINRVLSFAAKNFASRVEACPLSEESKALVEEVMRTAHECEESYSQFGVKASCKKIMDLARSGNRYFDERKPWTAFKTDPLHAQETLFTCLCLISKISVLFSPVLPKTMAELRALLGVESKVTWNEVHNVIDQAFVINEVKPIFRKILDEEIDQELERLQTKAAPAKAKNYKALKELISYDEFSRMDIRIARILSAQKVPKTDKLLHLVIDLGFEERELVAGIAEHYAPEAIVGKKVVVLANLEPRKIRGIVSQGMILAAEDENGLSILLPEKDSGPGSTVQ